ncbi:hypothetical protein CHGG_01991 [Chaetomium globosum CBS 148.51]|uniref:Heterokaryon incompatibility domain-containing protein n=1 Tax=Chaetomium globosum (strain ATCC 6205 / CBS 148.51 / DSM 1962 / NBRC 6347 / NRRL 1970) TaxID=306901 RepID=Q2HCR3_CHAGB|nr:uncharacterized protein CHGG_01991 [Chaetomium globosum CBS 148.51]EAQ93756.1 hypothetical protein CHGG_01991 [Chaetomium globosum CBS 148.51]
MICDRCRDALQGVASIDESWAVGLKHRPEEDVSDERVRMSYGIKHHPTYESFREALAQRCSVCIALWEGLEPEEQGIFENTTRTDPSQHPVTLTRHTRSPETLDLAKRWVTSCVRHHGKCRAGSGDGTWYPTRLLDLSRVTNTAEPWAGQRLVEGVSLGSLPQLMQDVIFVSLELGIHYIWIDLLCIFQDEDDITDWQQESALMNKVYSNTFCNISAGDANGCLESLFNTRDADSFLPQVIELQVGRGDHKTQLFRVYDLDYWRRSISGALVNKRGWVLQERFLSARVLQFDKRQVLWECLENCATETCPEQIPRHLLGRDHRIFKNMVNPTIQVEVRHLWTCLVQEYTACDLTVPSDKLVAVSGIAKHIAALLQDSHFYGKTSRPAEYRAPSWSWASIDGPVAPGPQLLKHPLIKVEEVHLEYLTDDVYGAVTWGWIRLRGALRQRQGR